MQNLPKENLKNYNIKPGLYLISTPIAYLNEVEGINNAGDIVKISNILKYINMNEYKKLYLPKIDL